MRRHVEIILIDALNKAWQMRVGRQILARRSRRSLIVCEKIQKKFLDVCKYTHPFISVVSDVSNNTILLFYKLWAKYFINTHFRPIIYLYKYSHLPNWEFFFLILILYVIVSYHCLYWVIILIIEKLLNPSVSAIKISCL